MNELRAVNSKIAPHAVREQLARILASEGFARARRMQRFLEFIVEQTLAGRAGELGEYWIAVSVFDRKTDFEPALDPIVRNDARRLRVKLAEYYRQPGSVKDPVVIDIPKGGYVPSFLAATSATREEVEASSATRVAVLPIEVAGNAEVGFCGQRIGVSLTAALTNLDGIQAVAHGFVRHESIQETASELRLSHVVNGYIWNSGDRFGIIVNLIQVACGTQVWAGEYEFESHEIALAHSEITADVLNEVKARLCHEVPRRALAMAA